MNRQPFAKPPRWWSPKLNRWWVSWWRPWRRRLQLNKHRLLSVEVRGLEPCLYPHFAIYRDGEFRVLALKTLAWRRLHTKVTCD